MKLCGRSDSQVLRETLRRVSSGGAQGAWAPLEIKKQKKKVINANFKLFHLLF